MMDNKTEISAHDRLELIQQMIQSAKRSFMNFSFYFLLWGWLLLLAGIGEYLLQNVFDFSRPYIVWIIVGVMGGTIASVKGSSDGQKSQGSSYVDREFAFLWSGFVVTIVLMIIAVVGNGGDPGSYIILITGLPTFVSGGVMRFRPLIIGGIVFWLVAIFSFFFMEEYRSLLFSLAILCGYIIPGYMLKKTENERV